MSSRVARERAGQAGVTRLSELFKKLALDVQWKMNFWGLTTSLLSGELTAWRRCSRVRGDSICDRKGGREAGARAAPRPSLPGQILFRPFSSVQPLSVPMPSAWGVRTGTVTLANPLAKREMFHTPESPKRHLSVIKVVTNGNKNEGYIL